MNKLLSLTKRNTLIYYRTKGNIFFSMLAVIILIALHFFVFRNMMTDNWEQVVKEFQGFEISREKLLWINDSLMFAAIIPISGVTVSLVALGLMTADREKNVLNDFLVAPVNRGTLLASYLGGSIITGIICHILFIIFFGIYFYAAFGILFSLLQILMLLAISIGSLVFANIFLLLLISFVKSEQSLGAIGTILGTSIGFISGSYIPVSMFGKTLSNVFSSLPFMQLTVISKKVFLYEIEKHTSFKQDMLGGEIGRSFGLELWIGRKVIPVWATALMTAGFTLVLLVLLIVRFSKMKKAD